jgi:beta-glucanase (GH16 family)
VHSRATLRHGYVEVRARPAAATCSSAFWLSDQRQGEIDVFEIGGGAPDFAYTVNSTLHLLEPGGKPRGPAQRSTWDLDQRPADGFHTYSLDWSAESIVVRVDGVVTARFANTQWHQPMPIILDVETMPDWFGLPHAEEPLPATFQVDYVRTWRAAEP